MHPCIHFFINYIHIAESQDGRLNRSHMRGKSAGEDGFGEDHGEGGSFFGSTDDWGGGGGGGSGSTESTDGKHA